VVPVNPAAGVKVTEPSGCTTYVPTPATVTVVAQTPVVGFLSSTEAGISGTTGSPA